MKTDYNLSRISFRLNQTEQGWLKSMLESQSSTNQTDSPTEFFRLLLAREWHRRYRKGKVKPEEWQSEWRMGGLNKRAGGVSV